MCRHWCRRFYDWLSPERFNTDNAKIHNLIEKLKIANRESRRHHENEVVIDFSWVIRK